MKYTTTSLFFVLYQSVYYLIQIIPWNNDLICSVNTDAEVFLWDGLADLVSSTAFIQSYPLPFPWLTLSASFALCSLGNYLVKSLEARVSNTYCCIIGTVLCPYASFLFLWKKKICFLPPHTVAEAVMGMFLTMAGITLCVVSSIDEQGPRQQNATQIMH